MKLPVLRNREHEGRSLELDCDREQITLLDSEDEALATVTWAAVIEFVRTFGLTNPKADVRAQPRASMSVKIRYESPGGRRLEAITTSIGGGGLFIESSDPLPPGTEFPVEFSLPDRPWESITAQARVAWSRTQTERIVLPPGMGVMFTEISTHDRKRVEELIAALNRAAQR